MYERSPILVLLKAIDIALLWARDALIKKKGKWICEGNRCHWQCFFLPPKWFFQSVAFSSSGLVWSGFLIWILPIRKWIRWHYLSRLLTYFRTEFFSFLLSNYFLARVLKQSIWLSPPYHFEQSHLDFIPYDHL